MLSSKKPQDIRAVNSSNTQGFWDAELCQLIIRRYRLVEWSHSLPLQGRTVLEESLDPDNVSSTNLQSFYNNLSTIRHETPSKQNHQQRSSDSLKSRILYATWRPSL